MKKTYAEKLRDPRWQKKRLEILQLRGWKCVSCEDSEEELHVHHRYYISGRDPWEYPDWCYEVKCKSCHQHDHDWVQEGFTEWETMVDELLAGSDGDSGLSFAYEIHCAVQRTHGATGKMVMTALECMMRWEPNFIDAFVRERVEAHEKHSKKTE